MSVKIRELEQKQRELQEKIHGISATLQRSNAEEFRAYIELKAELASVEDAITAQTNRVRYMKEQSNLGKRFASRTFGTFNPSDNRKAYEDCKWYVDEGIHQREKNGLILCGSYGTGKTHLAASIVNEATDQGISALFNTYIGHLEALKKEFNSDDERTYLDKMYGVELLVLDDVGKERTTEWTESVMFDVINNRYENMRPILITTNLNAKQLEDYFGGAVYSRLIEMCHMVVTHGKDHRR